MEFKYENFACISANAEECVFSNYTGGEIRIDGENFPCVPMEKYDFIITENDKGDFKISSFEKDKFNNFHLKLTSDGLSVTFSVGIDGYSKSDMKSFVLGNKFNFEFIV